MLNKQDVTEPIVVLTCAFIVRLGGVLITNLTTLNPDQGADTFAFANQAHEIASGNVPISDLVNSLGSTVPTWGLFISPFWLLPGPSEVYAQIFVAFLGSFAIFNIYLLIRYFHSTQAALLTVIPLIFLPSSVALHSVILRDAAILASLTYSIRLFVIPYQIEKSARLILIIISITTASLLRIENLPIYALVFFTIISLTHLKKEYYLTAVFVFFATSLLLTPVINQIFNWLGILRHRDGILDFLMWMRGARIREGGRTQYLTDVTLQTPTDVLLYAPLMGIYFLYAPFPWMAENIIDYLTVFESVIMIVFSIFAIRGWVALSRRNLGLATGLLAGLVLFITLYGIISVNVGTTVRQRQTFSWVIFALGAIGFTEQYKMRLVYSDYRSKTK
ncbi:hypothetical protein [Natronocalculus amylovorans]|uniref:Glycosyltransferase RgtA/B/C/D-like domain-containing protein n=1 Tax=Natronocalculus amylovorans TaxID=2917812 RepID=A0AAE3FY09_9EURY|nr:hypothetical protein [Natronocalculus amylovorans]MCL9817478.1 hypothetical protein [Natronocalculus amylovorans]